MSGLRACLLSGGASRRMGTDKALLPHPAGGTWLEFSLAQLAALPLPITLVSHHRAHLALAQPLRDGLGEAITVLEEPPPRQGPLLALDRLMQHHRDQHLLLCAVDMPWLQTAALKALVAAAMIPTGPVAIHLAHDGQRLQPLLGVYPAHASRRQGLRAFTVAGGRRLQDWLAGEAVVAVPLPPAGLRNANRPDDATGLWP
ncbi:MULTISPECIES: molybdenum cofactor guanylyltransferase [unclassified Cyanobium]|uniref:molybdenum cofactor guanylyltransferase n=1 Tax=unclassified Cyanobium TaxID=2627006 RepID=UPI0020CCA210|nr:MULTISPECIES: molybdenum cofactor guanylyltransferase [unclassified Cyanobium]MCP9859206.1 molybdenum cofactor guanylyltransferase [Cyanobium sp. Cruz-8H5]MCP9866401.1 molybdenum cofactor guanylyltransferase [Cyanobium sp. Cruz-8D1]